MLFSYFGGAARVMSRERTISANEIFRRDMRWITGIQRTGNLRLPALTLLMVVALMPSSFLSLVAMPGLALSQSVNFCMSRILSLSKHFVNKKANIEFD